MYFAYFAPFSFEAHQDLIARTQCDSRVTLELLGETLDGHDIDLLKIGATSSPEPLPYKLANLCQCSREKARRSLLQKDFMAIVPRLAC